MNYYNKCIYKTCVLREIKSAWSTVIFPAINLICGKKLVYSVGIITDVKIRIIVIMVMVKVALAYYCRAELLMDAFACVVKLPHTIVGLEIRDRACRRHSACLSKWKIGECSWPRVVPTTMSFQ